MGTKAVVQFGVSAAEKNPALIKSCKYGSNIERGNIVKLGALSVIRAEDQVYTAATPVTATLATDVFYVVSEPNVNIVEVGSNKYRIGDDPSDFYVPANTVFDVQKPQVGDEITYSADGIGGTKGANTYIIPANGLLEPQWASSISAVSLAFELKKTTTISIPGSTAKTAYRFVCVKA
jgi:hypothetical protein